MHRRRIRTAYVIQIARCMVCRLGLNESGADHMVMAAVVIDFRVILRQISVSL